MVETHFRVYNDRSEFIHEDGTYEVFLEGATNPETQERYREIQAVFTGGFLEQQILYCRDSVSSINSQALSQRHLNLLDKLVSSVTSEVGRALVALSIMQLSIKTIVPQQSIRLHKGGRSSRDFSWRDGISMRSLDKAYVTPILRKYDLVKLNADGFMMTRSLAENYPYTRVYKAKIRGARDEWLELVEEIEAEKVNTTQALQYLISQLINQTAIFNRLAIETLDLIAKFAVSPSARESSKVISIIFTHINNSGYAARVMEIAMHSLLQAVQEVGGLSAFSLKPLSQMRSANKKHGNIGDIELQQNRQIVEAWDAKFGKTYLRDELEEMTDKLSDHTEIRLAGFVTSGKPELLDELQERKNEIEDQFNIDLKILSFEEWVIDQIQRGVTETGVTDEQISIAWLYAFTETIAQKRRDVAPIDEPCYQWLTLLKSILQTHLAL